MTEYEYRYKENSKPETHVFFTNSTDNSYYLLLKEKEKDQYELYFCDFNGFMAKFRTNKKELSMTETFVLNCEAVIKTSNPYKYQVENYHFENRDTLIGDEKLPLYVLRANETKREKKKKLGRNYHIIEKDTGFHLPILDFVTAYEEYKTEKNIPNGIMKIFYFKGIDSKIKHLYTLKSWMKSTRYLSAPEPCNYYLAK